MENVSTTRLGAIRSVTICNSKDLGIDGRSKMNDWPSVGVIMRYLLFRLLPTSLP